MIGIGVGVPKANRFNLINLNDIYSRINLPDGNGTNVWACVLKFKPNTKYILSTNAQESDITAYVFLYNVGESVGSATNGVFINTPRIVTTNSLGEMKIGIKSNIIPKEWFVNGQYSLALYEY